jgi:hypothetical protein
MVFGPFGKAYVETPGILRDIELDCPVCWARGIRRRLSGNGSYIRWIPVGGKEERRDHTTAGSALAVEVLLLLPQDVLPGHRHSQELVAAGLWTGP